MDWWESCPGTPPLWPFSAPELRRFTVPVRPSASEWRGAFCKSPQMSSES